ncbi:acyltransferase family protein [Prevotella fusca]|uniref:acyltransferase family protein n=1 Tax=Prevotella fusca TaxID=589436 RepID=UPI000A741B6F|nr:acyltransferase family protein [Prevotella fusca]
MKQKIAEISFLHVFAILLVVIGHSFFQTESLIVDWIYQFHVPLFFFVSGYLFNVSVQGRKLQPYVFLRRKAVRLLLPYFALSTLLFVPKVLLSQFMVRPIQANWSEYVLMLIYPYHNVNGSYWFLPTLFFLFLFAVIALSLSRRVQRRASHAVFCLLLLVLAIISISLPFSHDTVFNIVGAIHYAFYFALGCFVSNFRLLRFLNKEITALLLFLLTFALSIIGLNVNTSPLTLIPRLGWYSYVACFGALIRKIQTLFLQSPLPSFLYHLSLSWNLSSIEYSDTNAIHSFRYCFLYFPRYSDRRLWTFLNL